MKTRFGFLLAIAVQVLLGCNKDDEMKPDNRNDQEIEIPRPDSITWSRTSHSYSTFIWQHHAKGDTCVSTTESATFYIGRNYNDGICYVRHIKATKPIHIYANHSEKELCSGCYTFDKFYWYKNVSGYKFYFYWGERKYWIIDLPSELK